MQDEYKKTRFSNGLRHFLKHYTTRVARAEPSGSPDEAAKMGLMSLTKSAVSGL